MTVHEGGCLCGAVRYKVEGEPLMSGACFCRDCRYVAGGAEAVGDGYLADALTVTKGETRQFIIKAASGADVTRYFCADCGVHLFAHNSTHPQFRSMIGWMRSQPWLRDELLAVWGQSRGGELALLLGATFADINAVIGRVPSDVTFWALGPSESGDAGDRAAWTFHGEPLPYL